MRSLKISGVLLLLVSNLLYVSCKNDDDDFQPIQLFYAIYNDQSNPVTNHQITINFPASSTTELLVSGGNGVYSVANTDDSRLLISGHNGYLQLTPLSPGDVTLTISDSEGNSYSLKVQIVDNFIRLKSQKATGNIYDLMVFNMYSERDFSVTSLTALYDSIVWTCTNTRQRFKIFDYSTHDSQLTFQWSNCFFRPASYETCLLSYKNNQLISADTVSVEITNSKDFLGYNWDEVTLSDQYSTGYRNVFLRDYHFASYSSINDGIPSVHLYLFYNAGDEVIFSRNSKTILSDYINSLYSAPTYSKDAESPMVNLYNDLFRNKEEGSTPEKIWITQKSKIVLLRKTVVDANYSQYEIYAEPAQ